MAFAYTDYDMRNLRTAGARLIQTFGATTKMRGVNMFPYAPHLGFWQVVFAGLEFGMLLVSTGGGKVMGTDGNISVIEKLKPEALIGIPTFVYHVIRQAHAEDYGVIVRASVAPVSFVLPIGARHFPPLADGSLDTSRSDTVKPSS